MVLMVAGLLAWQMVPTGFLSSFRGAEREVGRSVRPAHFTPTKAQHGLIQHHQPLYRPMARELAVAPLSSAAPFLPPSAVDDLIQGTRDFFLFIKGYDWSLRYSVGLEDGDASLSKDTPLEVEWVKLLRPFHNPTELLEPSSWQIFDWGSVAPAQHWGFMYEITQLIGSGVEAVINFFRGHDLRLLVSAEQGIQLRPKGDQEEPHTVTHCWVETKGLPFMPMPQVIAFYNLNQVVLDWHS